MRFAPIEVQLSADVAKREVTFYGAAFNNRDSQGHRILPRAFAKTIREQLPQGLVKHFRNHQISIGPMRHLEEDSYGLQCVGYCSKTRAGDEYLEQANDGSLTHASIYAKVVRDRAEYVPETDPTTGEDIETLNLGELVLVEAGLVDLLPANTSATLISVKNLGGADVLDMICEADYIVKSLGLAGREKLTPDERRVVKALLSLHQVLDEQGDTLKALLAPGDITHSSGNAPSLATPAHAETQIDLSALLATVQQLGRISL